MQRVRHELQECQERRFSLTPCGVPHLIQESMRAAAREKGEAVLAQQQLAKELQNQWLGASRHALPVTS